ncbi:alpha/beta fold hydrolase [Halomonas sp. ML-15]|uniref:alpha/beta fold hydrolase n=1 Tax=Halomonas sp. ML-15 TaxID=2773305 RepID=UPI0017470F23|nr:alpha/beta fold hydrolase [Halomonas sp. ML-15]MBD3896095.1 alpha/beta fold hydrolase [Halomonas sp. ML-15]
MNPSALIRNIGRLVSPVLPAASARLAESLATQPRRRSFRSDDAEADAETVTLRFGLKALRWGESGPVIIALHGWEGRPQQFRSLGIDLAGRGYQVFALTAPGHGDSPDREAHPGLFVDALLEAAGELGPVHGVIGHSMGAGAALLAQVNGLRVERSVCVAGPAGYRGVLERLADQLGLAPASRASFLRAMEARTGLLLNQTHPAEVLKSIDTRLLIVHDHDDPVVPYADAEAIVRHGSDRVDLLATRGLGHGRVLKDRAVVETITDFMHS